MRLTKTAAIFLTMVLLLTACGNGQTSASPAIEPPAYDDAMQIVLSDSGITADGAPVGTDSTAAVYTANDIVYYEAGKDLTYGEGTEKDAHSPDEAAVHTVVHITRPGAYSLSGSLSLGQIAVDLGDGAKDDPNAVVTLIFNGVDITCEVAPAVIFYDVYECGSDDAEKASWNVDTSASGANVIISDGTVNTVRGSYVARIYKPGSVVLNDGKTEVVDADKLHKYDGAFYSRRSMNIFGGKENTGILNIDAENEGLDSEMHLTVNGGDIRIRSGNDGINTNEDGVSVTTVNGGKLTILVTGATGEGDGIDSNGWLVINGGTVVASACSDSADAGIDSDMGIHINGGTVTASGHMLDRIEDGGQNYAVFSFAHEQTGSETVTMRDGDGKAVLEAVPENAYSILIFSSPDLKTGTYTLWSNEQQLAAGSGGMMGSPGMGPGGMERPGDPNGMQPPGDGDPAQAPTPPEGFTPPEDGESSDGPIPPQEGFTPPEGGDRPEMPVGGMPNGMPDGMPGRNAMGTGEMTSGFEIRDGGNMFSGVQPVN